jgi:hypothetical protein
MDKEEFFNILTILNWQNEENQVIRVIVAHELIFKFYHDPCIFNVFIYFF